MAEEKEKEKEKPKDPIEVVQGKNIMNELIEKGTLPSPEKINTFLSVKSTNAGVVNTQIMLKGLMNGDGMPPKSDLQRVLATY